MVAVKPDVDVWHNPDFLKLWTGGSISAIGSQVTVLAMPLIGVLTFSAGPGKRVC